VRASRRDGDTVVLLRRPLAEAPRAVARLALRAALAEAGGRRGVGARHLERLLALTTAKSSSGRALALPGRRVATVRFDEVRVGPRTEPKGPFAYPLGVPGRVQLPGGLAVAVEAEPAEGEPLRIAVPADAPLELRTRRPGDRVYKHGREVSLKRFLMERRIPAEERGGLPLLAAGPRVLWFPGARLEGRTGDRWIGLRLFPSGSAEGAGR
jgi:tRNA(Ile)-lysidine synthase